MVAERGSERMFYGEGTHRMSDDTQRLDELLTRFVSVSQAARLAGLHPATVRRAVDAGRLDGARGPAGRLVLRDAISTWAADVKRAA